MNLSGEDFIYETELITRVRRGDEVAWEPLVRRYQEMVFRLAYLTLGDEADAEDVTQETFIRAYLSLDKFDEERPFRPWLLSIAANLARNRRRSLGRYWAALQRFWQTEPLPVENPVESSAQVEAKRMWQAIRRLRPKGQEIIYLRYFLELSEAETASTLTIAPGTAKSRLHRALRQLRTVIEADFPDLCETWKE